MLRMRKLRGGKKPQDIISDQSKVPKRVNITLLLVWGWGAFLYKCLIALWKNPQETSNRWEENEGWLGAPVAHSKIHNQ